MAEPAADRRRRRALAALGLVISALLLAWVIHRIEPARVLAAVRGASLGWIAVAVTLKLTTIAIKALRWRFVLRETLGRPVRAVGRAVYAGYFGNAVLPMKLGEVMKIQLVRRHNEGSFTEIAATVLLERTLDALVLATMFAPVPLLVPLPPWATSGAATMSLIFAVGATLLWWLSARPAKLPGWLFPGRIGERAQSVLADFARGLKVARRPATLLLCAALTALAWSVEVSGTYCLLAAFVTMKGAGLGAALVLTCIVALGVAIPSAPAGVGTHQALYIVLLGLFGIGADAATAMSVTAVVLMVSALTVIGLAITWQEGLSMRQLRRTAEANGSSANPEEVA